MDHSSWATWHLRFHHRAMRLAFAMMLSLLSQHARRSSAALVPLRRPLLTQRVCASHLRMEAATGPHVIADVQILPSPAGTADDAYKHVDAAIRAISLSGLDWSLVT